MEKYKKMFLFVAFSCILLGLFSSCGKTKLMSGREVEAHLEELYGEKFDVISFENVPSDNQSSNVWKARVYRVAPQENPEFEFFAFCILRGESGGIPGVSLGITDNFLLEKLGSQLLEHLDEMGADYEVSYGRYPFMHSEVYYSHMSIFVNVSQDNLFSHCIALSTAFKGMFKEVPTAGGSLSGIAIVFEYHADHWEEDQICSIEFTPFYGSDLNTTQGTTNWGVLDIETDTIYNSCLQRIQRYTENHGLI